MGTAQASLLCHALKTKLERSSPTAQPGLCSHAEMPIISPECAPLGMGNWVTRSFNHCKCSFFKGACKCGTGKKKKKIFQSTEQNPICVLISGCKNRRLFWDENAGRNETCCLDLLDVPAGWGLAQGQKAERDQKATQREFL